MRHALKRPVAAGAITLVVASSWTSSVALAGCTATALSASAGVFGPPSISATESSTAQALELIRQRRMQVAEACPTGFTRAGGICQPVAQTQVSDAGPAAGPSSLPGPAASAPPSSPAQVPGAGGSSARPKAAARSTTVARADTGGGGGSLKDSGGYAPAPSRLLGSWVEGFADWERHDDVRPDIAGNQKREMYSTGILSGLDATDLPRGIQFGVLSGYTYSQAKFSPFFGPRVDNEGTTRNNAFTFDQKQAIEGSSVGLYASYFEPSGFSADLLYKVDLFDLTQSDTSVSNAGCGNNFFSTHEETTMTNNIIASNIAYRWSIGGGRWVEPTAGIRYTHTDVGGNAVRIGLDDGDAIRLQGGVRVGQVWYSGNYLVTTALTGLLYSDVMVSGFTLPGIGSPPGLGEIDEGKLRVLGLAQAKIDLLNGTSWYGQVEVRGGEDLIGVGGKVGLRVQW